jgi:hypothetical protein
MPPIPLVLELVPPHIWLIQLVEFWVEAKTAKPMAVEATKDAMDAISMVRNMLTLFMLYLN